MSAPAAPAAAAPAAAASSPPSSPPSSWHPPDTFVLDLDVPPRRRWTALIERHLDLFPRLQHDIRAIAIAEYGGEVVGPCIHAVMARFAERAAAMYTDPEWLEELQGVAEVTSRVGFSLGELLVFNAGYDLLARCTSAVLERRASAAGDAADAAGTAASPYHVRLMDWDADALVDRVVHVNVVQRGRVIACFTTWPGMVGVLTGMRWCTRVASPAEASAGNMSASSAAGASAGTPVLLKDGFTVAVNYRHVGDSIVLNVWHALRRRAMPVSFACRRVLQDESTFRSARDALLRVPLMAPVYLTMIGTRPGEACILTRGREDSSVTSTSAVNAITTVRSAADGDHAQQVALTELGTLPSAVAAVGDGEGNEEECGRVLVQTNCDAAWTETSMTPRRWVEWSEGDWLSLSSLYRKTVACVVYKWSLAQLARAASASASTSSSTSHAAVQTLLRNVAVDPVTNLYTNYVVAMCFQRDTLAQEARSTAAAAAPSPPSFITYESRAILDPARYCRDMSLEREGGCGEVADALLARVRSDALVQHHRKRFDNLYRTAHRDESTRPVRLVDVREESGRTHEWTVYERSSSSADVNEGAAAVAARGSDMRFALLLLAIAVAVGVAASVAS